MEKIIERISNLITVKSLITLPLTFVFCFLAVKGVIPADKFVEVFMIIIGFYYGVQTVKGKE